MDRKYMQDLISWNENSFRKPLIVWGARQVGKSYLIKDLFAEKFYPGKYIYVDCKKDIDFVKYCESHMDPKDILNYLSLDFDMMINNETLLIFDEAQECLPIITLLKYFCQEYREIPIIVTGSMVRIKIQRETRKRGEKSSQHFLFPIGKINQLTIYPLNFGEFLMNRNKVLYKKIKESYQNKEVLDELYHEKALACFYDYLLVGGMPEAVDAFLKTGSYQVSRTILKDLYDNYLGDMDLYQASPESIVRSKKVFENIYMQLNRESKNFSPSLIEKDARTRDVQTPIDWLSLAFLVNKASILKEKVTTPLIDSSEGLFRLYLSDIGMFSYQSGINAKTFISKESQNTLSGLFFENYVACELVNHGIKLFYWKGKSNAEFEFILEKGGKLIPVDVKKGRGVLNSLEKFKNHNSFEYALKISNNKYGYDQIHKILTIPFYELFAYLDEFVEDDF